MRVLFIINPIAGDIPKDEFIRFIKSEMIERELPLYTLYTTGEDDEQRLLRKVQEVKPHRIISVGGDGTLLLVCQTLLHKAIPIGIVPLGSANGMAEELGIPKNPIEALSVALDSLKKVPLDLILFNSHLYGMHIADVGMNAKLVEAYDKDPGRGLMTYAKYLLPVLENAPLLHFEILADGIEYHRQGYMLAIANAQKYGTGVIINPKGKFSDGKFELCILKDKSINTIMSAGLTIFSPELFRNESMEVISCEKASIKLKEKYMFQIDGEVIGEVDHITAEPVHNAIEVFVPHLRS
ncbi:diacylglycerol/lipid kinase family protein [Algivirga pacifica]|uniref:Diacylglycerol kinase family lipid kinase n=1 Tax=Algivirga pacifica TaxID=1162670 RepID=A0ABP9D5G4_9BACT